MVLYTALRLGTTTFAALVAVALVGVLLRYRDRASARALLGVGVFTSVGSLLHLLVADLTSPNAAIAVTGWDVEASAWVVIGTTTTVIAGGLWVLFAFRYTGRSRRVVQATGAIIGAISIGAVMTAALAVRDPSPLTFQLLTVTFLLMGFLVTIGVFLLLWMSIDQQAVPLREPLLLAGGAIVLLSGSFVAQIFERPVILPALTAIAGGLFLFAVVRYPVFETPPAVRVLGRDRVVGELADGILIVDRSGRVRDLNPAGERLFDVSRASVLEDAFESLFPTAISLTDVAKRADPVRIELPDGTTVSVTADPVTDGRGRRVGHLITCTDVTARQRREEQLTLLSRFVVEVIQGRMTAVADEVTEIENTSFDDAPEVAGRMWERTTQLTTLVAQTRSIERAIAENGVRPDERLAVGAVLRELRDSITTEAGPQMAVDTPADAIDTAVNSALLASLLEPVLEDACAHAVTQVEVTVETDPPTVRIIDDRPDVNDRAEKGSDADLSLAVSRLALDQLGGHLSVERASEGRRAVVVVLPSGDTRETDRPHTTGGDA